MAKDRGIKLNGFFGLIIKPQSWGDLVDPWHGVSPPRVCARMGITVITSWSFGEAQDRHVQTNWLVIIRICRNCSGETKEALLSWSLCRQRTEVFGCRQTLLNPTSPLACAQHGHALDASQRALRGLNRLEPQHRMRDALDRPMVLLHHIFEIAHVPDADHCPMSLVVAPNG
jgi:hypothetical protein